MSIEAELHFQAGKVSEADESVDDLVQNDEAVEAVSSTHAEAVHASPVHATRPAQSTPVQGTGSPAQLNHVSPRIL